MVLRSLIFIKSVIVSQGFILKYKLKISSEQVQVRKAGIKLGEVEINDVKLGIQRVGIKLGEIRINDVKFGNRELGLNSERLGLMK